MPAARGARRHEEDAPRGGGEVRRASPVHAGRGSRIALAVRLVAWVFHRRSPFTLRELMAAHGLRKRTAHRWVGALEEAGLVERIGERYRGSWEATHWSPAPGARLLLSQHGRSDMAASTKRQAFANKVQRAVSALGAVEAGAHTVALGADERRKLGEVLEEAVDRVKAAAARRAETADGGGFALD